MRPQTELNHLKYFYFTVLEGGVNLAAQRLCVQQPVVSKMIKSLESQLGKALFKKVGRKNILTDFGQLVFRHSQAIFEEVDKIDQLEQKPEDLKGAQNLGASEPLAAHFLPEVLDPLMNLYPLVNWNVYTSTASQLLEMISNGKLEIGFFFHIPQLPSNLEIIEKVPTRFHLVIKAERKNDLNVIQSFIGSREIDDLENHKFPTVDFMRKRYPKTRIIFSSNHLGLHRRLVLKGKGVSILPRFMIQKDLAQKKLSDLYPKEKFIFDLKVISRKKSPAAITTPIIKVIKDIHYI